MCGIVGFLAREARLRQSLGEFVVPMLTCMGERGPDSAGLAVFSEPVPADQRRFNIYAADRAFDWHKLAAHFAAQIGFPAEVEAIENHAVLVSLCGASILHFRRGRTNWEYVATLAPAIPWRRGFIDLTQRFEHEWYGTDESTPEALEECQRRARAILESVARATRGAA